MVNNKDSSDSKTKKSTFCGHLMPSFDTHRYCYKCRESGKGDDLCIVKIVFFVLHFLKIRNRNSLWSCDLFGGRTHYCNPMAWLRLLHNLKIASLHWPLGWMAPTNSSC